MGHMGKATGATRRASKATGGIHFAVQGTTGDIATEPKFDHILREFELGM